MVGRVQAPHIVSVFVTIVISSVVWVIISIIIRPLLINIPSLHLVSELRYCIDSAIEVILSPSSANFVLNILFGTKEGVKIDELISNNGIAFLLSVSGIKFSFLQQYTRRLFHRFGQKWRLMICILISLIYFCLLDKITVSTVRAVLMIEIFNFAKLFGRKVSYEFVLFVVLAVLSFQDMSIWSQIGFQLMLSSILSIHYLMPLIKKRLKLPNNILVELCLASFVIWLTTSPILYLNLGEISLVSLPASIFVMPFLAILFSFILPAIFITILSQPIGKFLFAPIELVIKVFLSMQQLIHNLFGSLYLSDNLLLVIYLALFISTIFVALPRNKLCKLNVF